MASVSSLWREEWQAFKEQLPHKREPYSKRNWGSRLHSLCSFPGKLKPAIAYHLVEMFTPSQGTILDIFSGVGTIPFEGSLNGRTSYAFELSPLGFAVTGAKLQMKQGKQKVQAVISELSDFIEDHNPTREDMRQCQIFGLNGKIADYYHRDTLRELLVARQFFKAKQIRELTPSEKLVMSAALHVLHGNRPYALSRRSHPITPYAPSGETIYKSVVEKIKTKVERSIKVKLPSNFKGGHAYLHDSTKLWPQEVTDIDAIITSPPFYDSTKFINQNWLRLWFAGWSPDDFKIQSSSFVGHRQKQEFATVYGSVFRLARERLKPDGVMVLHLGKNNKMNMAEELIGIAKTQFENYDLLNEDVAHLEKHGISDKGNTTSHQYLVLY